MLTHTNLLHVTCEQYLCGRADLSVLQGFPASNDHCRWTFACLDPTEREVVVTFESYLGCVDRGQFHHNRRLFREVVRCAREASTVDVLSRMLACRLLLTLDTPLDRSGDLLSILYL